jgi:rubrerythrin
LSVSPEGSVAEVESVSSTRITCPVGRRPAGLAPPATTQKTTPVADLFAEIARLEASAVAAFDVMIGELTELGAPPVLVTAARRARADEVRHTEMMGEICRAYGVEPMAPEIAAPQRRTPFEIALENAVEGCVRETYGSLVAAHQALKAMDPRVARAMEIIADDEIRHAELSWALAAWLEPRLSDEERARIEAAKRLAVAELAEAARETLDESIVRLAGMPDPPSHAAMIAQLATDIWA